MKLVLLIIFTLLIIAFSSSCTRDKIAEEISECAEEVTYQNGISAIFETSCSYSGCHSGPAPGNFTNYDGIASYIDGGLLERRVLVDRNMPPINATGGPTSLSDEEIELFKCWVQAGYPEN